MTGRVSLGGVSPEIPAEPDDETTVVVRAVATAPPVQVWDVLVNRTDEWWGAPYLDPAEGGMQMEPNLGGRVWSGSLSLDADGGHGSLHGTIRAFDPPERLEIGGVLVPGSYAGSITITLESTKLGTEIQVEQMARGRVTSTTEERMAHGWTTLTAALTELADT